MLPPHLCKFSELYDKYGLGAVKNLWLLMSLITVARTVNLNKLKDYVGGVLSNKESEPGSHYKRLTRFFGTWSDQEAFVHDVMVNNLRLLRKLGFNKLLLDGTSWTIGKTKVHYMVLSVLVKNVAVPLYWVQLEKRGASSQEERKEMFDKALSLFDLRGMTLLADREYIGKEWFKYLNGKGIKFVIRLKFSDYYCEVDAFEGKSYQGMYDKCRQKGKLVKKQICLAEERYWIVMIPNPKLGAAEEVIIFLTTLAPTMKTTQLYALRWKIECLFFHLKTNGYNMEDLNLKGAAKSRLMMAVVAGAYLLAVREGWKRRSQIPIQRYKDGTQTLEISIFRKGLAIVVAKCLRFVEFLKYISSIFSPRNHPICKNVQ